MKTTELSGRALDYAVAVAEGATTEWRSNGPFWWDYHPVIRVDGHDIEYRPSTGPAGDDIIDREKIGTTPIWNWQDEPEGWRNVTSERYPDSCRGATRREAAMRCYVLSKLGDEVDIPKELIG